MGNLQRERGAGESDLLLGPDVGLELVRGEEVVGGSGGRCNCCEGHCLGGAGDLHGGRLQSCSLSRDARESQLRECDGFVAQ